MAQALTLSSLPLFPLGCVLFPGGVLALRVFELRYLTMVRSCRQTGAPFGVVALTQGSEVRRPGAAQEQFCSTGTLAHIEQFEQPQPDLIMLRCRASARFRITAQRQLRAGLWSADAALIAPDLPVPVPGDLKKTALALARLLLALHQRQPQTSPAPTPAQTNDCAWVANRWCELLPLPLDLRQRLMELQNPLVRLELVGDMLERMGIVGA